MVYARFGRTRKGSGAYGRKRAITRRRRSSGLKKVSRPRFATVGFARNVEKKYFDKTMNGGTGIETASGVTAGSNANGITYASTAWTTYGFNTTVVGATVTNDLLKGVGSGTDARSRIGNKIKVKYIKGTITCMAAHIATGTSNIMNGEELVQDATAVSAFSGQQYMRTTMRVCIVRDKQVNSTATNITWNDVFENGNGSSAAGVHAELNVDNMGRFMILEDTLVQLTADDPVKTMRFNLPGSKVGSVRYNGSGTSALTDQGVYIIWSAYVMGNPNLAATTAIGPSVNSRLCFTDD